MSRIDDIFDLASSLTADERVEFLNGLAECDRELVQQMLNADNSLQQKPEFMNVDDVGRSHETGADFEATVIGDIEQDEANDASAIPTPVQEIQQICDQFTDQLQRSERPSISDYAARIDENSRDALVRNLLHIDIDHRWKNGEAADSKFYNAKLPEHKALISNALLEATASVLQGDDTDDPDNSGTPVSLTKGRLLGDFQLLHELGRGGMGTVYEAKHIKRGFHVALKVLPAVDGKSLQFFKSEFRRVAEINHPNLVTLHTLQADGGVWFFTMELIHGKNFLSYVAPNERCDEQRLRASINQLAAAVFKLHGENIIHCDLKPTNVLVDQNGRVVVLDFGLSFQDGKSDHMSTHQLAGTPAYMAPEQAASRPLTGAADWYAIGAMLYRAITGSLPITGSSPLEIIQKKQVQVAPRCEPPDESLSDLADLTDQLLQIDPIKRPNAMDVAGRLATGVTDLHTESSGVVGSVLVGRETQLTALQSAFEKVRTSSKPQVVFVSGRSGEGKTSLVEHFLSSLGSHQLALCGRCYDRESVPFKALDGLIDQLTNHLRKLPATEAAILMPDDIGFLGELFPVLNRVPAVSEMRRLSGADLDHQQVRTRAFGALRLLLTRMSRDCPLILFSDDVQWGDADSAEALFQLLDADITPSLLLVCSFRSDEEDSSPFLQKWRNLSADAGLAADTVSVAPLSLEHCTDLAVQTLAKDNASIRKMVFQFVSQTGGNPMLFLELLSCYDPDEDSFEAVPIEELIARKLDRLPGSATPLLRFLAVAGRRSLLDEIAIASGTVQDADAVATTMRSEKLIRITGEGEDLSIDTYHDKIREAVLRTLDQETKIDLHREIGKTIEALTDSAQDSSLRQAIEEENPVGIELQKRLFDLSYHFDLAGDSDKALTYSCLAAQQAARQFSQSASAEQFTIAARHLKRSIGSPYHHIVAFGRARAHSLLGQYDTARQLIHETELTSDRLRSAKMFGLEAEIAHKQGDVEAGANLYRKAMKRLGYFAPRKPFLVGIGLLREICIQIVHTYLPRFLYFRDRDPTEEEELAVEVANRSSIVNYYRSTVDMLYWHLRGFNLAEQTRESHGLAYSYGLHPAPLSAVSLLNRGLRYSNRARGMAKRNGDVLTLGHIATMRVLSQWTRSRYTEVIAEGETAVENIESAGDPYLLFIVGWHASISLFKLGRTTDGLRMACRGFSNSIRSGEMASSGNLLWALSLICEGNLPFAELRGCAVLGTGDIMSQVNVKMAEGVWHLRFGRFDDAISCMTAARHLAFRRRVIVPQFFPGYPWLVAAFRKRAEASGDSQTVRQSWKRVRWYVWESLAIARAFPMVRAHLYREIALFQELLGKRKASILWMERSLNAADDFAETIEHAKSTVALNNLRKDAGLTIDEVEVKRASRVVAQYEDDVNGLDLTDR